MNIKEKLDQLDRLSDNIKWNEGRISNYKRYLAETDPFGAMNLFNWRPRYNHRLEIALKVRTRLHERWVRAVREIEKHYDNLEL
jgi:hypothetical protein